MKADSFDPMLLNEPQLPSFASIREKNLKTLYGDIQISEYINNDKSPKGSVDEKIRPLVNLINLHPEFVTLSSCSGRVAMFDPIGSCLESSNSGGEMAQDESYNNHLQQKTKGTEISGKGRGKWIFVTHDILPNLGEQIIESLKQAGTQRLQTIETNSSPITFKYEPPLLHIAASSLAAGKKLLHLAKSTCAMRESGLVVTDQRITVEIRTTGTLMCLPLLVQSKSLTPNEDYLKVLADLANERMKQNTLLLDKLYNTIQYELFQVRDNHSTENYADFNVSFDPLPSLNLWKCASVAIPSSCQSQESDYDCNVLAFGGQGIGPQINSNKTPPCKRWDAVFRLSRENGIWAKNWSRISITTETDDIDAKTMDTSVGTFIVDHRVSLGAREGHTACLLPYTTSSLSDAGVIIFGGRTGGPMSPSNDIFIFKLNDKDEGIIGSPMDVRGASPVPRFGHSMNVISSKQSGDNFPLAVIAGGCSGEVALSCIHMLSRSLDVETGVCHLLWEQIADMPQPRCYHSSTVQQIIDLDVDELFVFGGTSKPDDPFTPTESFLHKISIQRRDDTFSKDCIISDDSKLPESIGGAACSFHTDKPGSIMLLSGGIQSEDNSGDEDPFHITKWKFDAFSNVLQAESAGFSISGCRKDLDLGSLVHHNMINLQCNSSDSYSAVLVGGGVPSFSFGQSFAR